METAWKTALWQQFGAAIDTLDDMLRACPDDLWTAPLWETKCGRPEPAQYWYRVYHALFWLELYLAGDEDGFAPLAPFTLIEMHDDALPERPYTKAELQGYLAYGRRACAATVDALTDETAARRCRFAWGDVSFGELLLYNMRHVQEIAAQLSLFLGQHGVAVPDYVTIARERPA